MVDKPKFTACPGLAIRDVGSHKSGSQWEARWQARHDLVVKGYRPKSVRLWRGLAPTESEQNFVSEQCQFHQAEMLAWGRGGTPDVVPFNGTLGALISCYQTDKDSTYHKLRYHIRMHQDNNLLRIARERGDTNLTEVKARVLLEWHRAWLGPGGDHIAMAHQLINLLRTIFRFGLTILEDPECKRLCLEVLGQMKFPQSKPPVQWMTAEQANAIRAGAHAKGWHSIALAQAFQFELMLRQKDVIGEWVPQTEPGISDVTNGNEKWLRGLRWSEIEGSIIRHTTSKRQKDVEFDLRLAPMVMEELAQLGDLPTSGPIIVNEFTGMAYKADEFRRKFRIIARAAGVPDAVKSMQSRAGAITEATNAGAPLEHIRHAATHSDIAMTQRYSRDTGWKVDGVMKLRVAHRNKGGTVVGLERLANKPLKDD